MLSLGAVVPAVQHRQGRLAPGERTAGDQVAQVAGVHPTAVEGMVSGTAIVGDAFAFLAEHRGPVVASLPTATELDMDVDVWWNEWVPWAIDAIHKARGDQPCAFVQTDRLAGGRQYSWPARLGGDRPFTWHKIALTRPPGIVDLHRPTFRHVIAIGGRPGKRTPDVIDDGHRLWANGTGWTTARFVAGWFATTSPGRTILNPFCGHGTFLCALEGVGVDAIGCDIDPVAISQANALLAARGQHLTEHPVG